MRIISFLLLSILTWGSLASARDIFVNNLSGNDIFDGLREVGASPGVGPVKSINQGLRRARPGDRVLIANTGESYREAVTMQGGNNSGLHGGYPLVIEGHGAVIEGQRPIADHLWESIGEGVFRANCRIRSHQAMFLADKPATRIVLNAKSPTKPALEPLQYFLWDGFLYFRVEAERTPYDYAATCAQEWTGLTLYDVRNVVIKDLTLRGFALDGVNAHDNVFDVRLENVVSEDHGRSGFSVGGASRITLDRCAAANNPVAQLRLEGSAQVTLAECEFNDTTAPASKIEGGQIVEQSQK